MTSDTAGNVYVCGIFNTGASVTTLTNTAGNATVRLAKYNGTNWNAFNISNVNATPYVITGIAANTTNVYIITTIHILIYNITTTTTTGSFIQYAQITASDAGACLIKSTSDVLYMQDTTSDHYTNNTRVIFNATNILSSIIGLTSVSNVLYVCSISNVYKITELIGVANASGAVNATKLTLQDINSVTLPLNRIKQIEFDVNGWLYILDGTDAATSILYILMLTDANTYTTISAVPFGFTMFTIPDKTSSMPIIYGYSNKIYKIPMGNELLGGSIITSEVNRLTSKATSIDNAIDQQRRVAGFNSSYMQKLAQYRNMIMWCVGAIVLCLGLQLLSQYVPIPAAVLNVMYIVIASIGVLYAIGIFIKIQSRNNMDFNQLELPPPGKAKELTAGEKAKAANSGNLFGTMDISSECKGAACCATPSSFNTTNTDKCAFTTLSQAYASGDIMSFNSGDIVPFGSSEFSQYSAV